MWPERGQKEEAVFSVFGLAGLSHETVANYIKHTNPQAARHSRQTWQNLLCSQETKHRTKPKGEHPESECVCVCVCVVYYQSLHGLDMCRVDGQGLLIPAFCLVYVAPQLGYLPPRVQHIMGCREEVGGFLGARWRLGRFGHADVHLGYQKETETVRETSECLTLSLDKQAESMQQVSF